MLGNEYGRTVCISGGVDASMAAGELGSDEVQRATGQLAVGD